MNILAIDLNKIQNIRKQGLKKAGTFSSPLNTTNLKGGQSCLEIILVRHFSKIHHHFLHYLNNQKTCLLNANQHFSTIESLFSTIDLLFSKKLTVEKDFFVVEGLKKDLKMQTNDYMELLSGGVSTKFNKDSTSFNKIQNSLNSNSKNLSLWAIDFIKTHRLDKDRLKGSVVFRSLSRQKKQAIYYQLRKRNNQKLKSSNKKKSRGVNPLTQIIKNFKRKKALKEKELVTKTTLAQESFKGAIFLAIESIVIFLSHTFYFQFGLSSLLSWTLAAVVESSYTVLSGSQKLSLKILKWMLLSFSMFSVCYSSFLKDPALKRKISFNANQITQKNKEINELKKDLRDARKDKEIIQAGLSGLISYGKISVGFNKLTDPKAKITSQISRIRKEIRLSQKELSLLREKNSLKKVFTLKNLKSLETKTHAWIFLMLLLQIISSKFIGSICETLRTYIKQNKRKTKERKNTHENTPVNPLDVIQIQ